MFSDRVLHFHCGMRGVFQFSKYRYLWLYIYCANSLELWKTLFSHTKEPAEPIVTHKNSELSTNVGNSGKKEIIIISRASVSPVP